CGLGLYWLMVSGTPTGFSGLLFNVRSVPPLSESCVVGLDRVIRVFVGSVGSGVSIFRTVVSVWMPLPDTVALTLTRSVFLSVTVGLPLEKVARSVTNSSTGRALSITFASV